jgi:hypothetical protein
MKLPKTSENAMANEPSEEFCWTWVQLAPSYDHGQFHRTEEGAIREVNSNFVGFCPSMAQYKVVIVNVTKGWNL